MVHRGPLRAGAGRSADDRDASGSSGSSDVPLPGFADDSDLLGGSGLAFLRPDRGDDAQRGAFFRYGPTLSHGHADELGLNVFAAGRETSFDPGYGKGQYRNGWTRQTVAHLTTVVDERTQLTERSPGGSLVAFAPGAGTGVSVVAARDPGTYPRLDLDTYRRTVATVDTGPDHSYVLDLSRVDGGGVRDYSLHAAGVGFETDLDPGPRGEGSIASPDYQWGETVRGNGAVAGDGFLPGFDDRGWGWNAPPRNGYGFLSNPRRAPGGETWRATWSDERDPGARVRYTVLGADERSVVLADGPAPMGTALGAPDRRVTYALARDVGPDPSRFVSVCDPVAGDADADVDADEATEFPVASVDELAIEAGNGDPFGPVALRIDLADGRRDYAASTVADGAFAAAEGVRTDATFAWARFDEAGLLAARLVAGTHFAVAGATLSGLPAAYEGTVESVAAETGRVTVAGDLPAGDALAGAQAVFDAPEYSHNSPYPIAAVERADDGTVYLDLDCETTVLARGELTGDPTGRVLPNGVYLSFVRNSVHLTDGGANTFFDGKRVTNGERATTVESVSDEDWASLSVADAEGFTAGDEIAIHDVRPGDRVRVPTAVAVRRTAPGEYAVDAPEPVDVESPGGGAESRNEE